MVKKIPTPRHPQQRTSGHGTWSSGDFPVPVNRQQRRAQKVLKRKRRTK